MRSRKRTRTAAAAVALAVACLAAVLPGSSATLVSAVEAVTRGIGAKLQEFKGGEGLVVSPADIEGLLNTPCGEFFWWGGWWAVAAAEKSGAAVFFFLAKWRAVFWPVREGNR